MQCQQPVAVPVHGEAGHDPDDLPQEHDHRGDVEELHPQRLRAQIHHGESGRARRRAGAVGVPRLTDRLRSHHEVGEFGDRARADLLCQIVAAGREHPGHLVPPHRHRPPPPRPPRRSRAHHATHDSAAASDAWQQALGILDALDHPDAGNVRLKLHRLEPAP